ncbi:MAG TPA: hypothetical protein VF800_21075 [Telluria sp.]|jgi:hypothetical protein
MKDAKNVETEIQILVKGAQAPITLAGNFGQLHDNPQKIHQLLDLLELPKGTEVKVITKAASVIVR